MARIRSIKPEFWEDETIGSLSIGARLLFIATWNIADDEGRMRWSAPFLKSRAFMYDEDVTVDIVITLMRSLEDARLVLSYTAGKGDQCYAVIPSFGKYQKPNRPQESRLPAPPDNLCSERSVNVHCASSAVVVVGEVVVEESSGSAHLTMSEPPTPSADFEAFWRVYPRRVGKKNAHKAWLGALKRAPASQILAGLERVIPSWTDPQFTPHPATWLNRDGWLDEPDPPKLNPSLAAVVAVANRAGGTSRQADTAGPSTNPRKGASK